MRFFITVIFIFLFSLNNVLANTVDKKTSPTLNAQISKDFGFIEDVEETGLEVVWNEWHANVRNFIHRNGYPDFYRCNVVMYSLVVNKNNRISDVVVYWFPVSSLTIIQDKKTKEYISIKVKKDAPFYMYWDNKGTYLKAKPLFALDVGNEKELPYLIENSRISVVKKQYVPFSDDFKLLADKLNNCGGHKILNFPYNSKREKVSVIAGIQDLAIEGKTEFSSNDFNDIER